MQSLTVHTRVGNDGILKLETPVKFRDAEVEVALVVQPVKPTRTLEAWPANFFTEIIGGWEGAPLIREPE